MDDKKFDYTLLGINIREEKQIENFHGKMNKR